MNKKLKFPFKGSGIQFFDIPKKTKMKCGFSSACSYPQIFIAGGKYVMIFMFPKIFMKIFTKVFGEPLII